MAASLAHALLVMPIVASLNHMLKADPALQSRMRAHAGKRIELRVAPFPPQTLAIASSGLVHVADHGATIERAEADLLMDLSLARLTPPTFSRAALLDHLRFTGDDGLAALAREVVRCASLDVEDDLAKLIGDIPARRLSTAATALLAGAANSIERVAQNVAEYLVHERGAIVSSVHLATLADDLKDVVAKLEALESRMNHIEDAARRMQ